DNGERYGTGRQVVKVAQFQVASDVVSLPVSAVTVYRSLVDGLAISDVALSNDAALPLRLAFSTEQATSTAGVWLYQVLMCNALPCAPGVEFASTTVKALDLAIGRNLTSGAERVYFDNAHRDIRMIERSDVGWSTQILVSSVVDYTGESSVQLYEPSVLSIAGQDDRVSFTSRAGAGAWRVDIYDVATATLNRSVGLGYGPSWTLSPSIDEIAPNTLVASLPGATVQTKVTNVRFRRALRRVQSHRYNPLPA
ncbi:MAG: hypothetical protein NT024_15245, partial [Proteobacteria bacterium]|nr:hypothetical protein [Pseudomonadota bacterium]